MKRAGAAMLLAVTMIVSIAAATSPGATPTMVAQAMPPDGSLSWLALGDSYSSGEGIGKIPTNNKCQRADNTSNNGRAWSVVAADKLRSQGVAIPEFRLTACTGAVASQWVEQLSDAGGQPADLVTFSFGGNNLGFFDIILDCVGINAETLVTAWSPIAVGPTLIGNWKGCSITEGELRQRVAKWTGRGESNSTFDVGTTLPQLLDEIAAGATVPGGKIVVTGYPQIFEESGRWGIWEGNACQRFNRGDANMLRGVIAALNQQIAQTAADRSGKVNDVEIIFVDAAAVYESQSGRHGLCSGDPWINGITPSRLERSFHPTEAGHEALGNTVADRIAGLDFSGVAPGRGTRCGPVQTEDGPLETEITGGYARCPEVLDVLEGLVGTPSAPGLTSIGDDQWRLDGWSCRADTRADGAITYSCERGTTRIATVAVAPKPEPEEPDLGAGGADPSRTTTVSCSGTIESVDPLQIARLTVDAINSANGSVIDDCAGSPEGARQARNMFGRGPWAQPTSCTFEGRNYSCAASGPDGTTIFIIVYADTAGAQLEGIEGPLGGA